MKTLLITGYDEVMRPLGDLTAPLMLSYASRHGMDFLCARQFPKDTPAYWHKLNLVVDAFKVGYGRVIWLDADQMITNPECYCSDIAPGFHASLDWGKDVIGSDCFSMCGFIASKESQFLFDFVLENKDQYAFGEFPDQKPMRELYQNNALARSTMMIHDRKFLNAVPIEVHPTVVEFWRPGDFAAHITMLSVPERVAIFHKIKAQLS